MRLYTRSIFLVFLFAFSCLHARADVSVGISADFVSGCAPLVVHFSGTASGAPTGSTYHWDFGNGTTSTYFPLTSTSYVTPGTYTVTLTVTTPGGITYTHTITITVFPAPVVSFTASTTTPCPGAPVTFTSTTTSGVPGAMTLTWNFGDGSSGTGSPVTHTYPGPGFYNVTLVAVNADGCTSSLTVPSYIHVLDPPVPNFTALVTHFCSVPAHAVFTNLSTGTPGLTYHWTFGDGSPPSTLASPTHDYTSPGSYTVTLVVTDGAGCVDSITRPAYITISDLSASFTEPTTACVYSTITFPNTSGPHSSSAWYYGDGGSSFGDPGSHMYTAPGTYTVMLVISDGLCNDTVTHSITILPGPATSFTISPTVPCPAPVAVTFTGSAPSGTSVSWIYGDGTSGAGVTSTHTYGHRGVDTIRMISTAAGTGCIDTVKQVLILYDLWARIFPSVTAGCVPLSVTFTASAVTYEPDTLVAAPYPLPIVAYSWNFGDGSAASTGATPTHVYTAVGIYNVVLTITTANGCTTTDSVQIRVGKPPVVTFTATPLEQCFRDNLVTFTATIISGPVSGYHWQFGDGNSANDSIPTITHTYTVPGIFSVTLTPDYNGCYGPPVVFTNYITIDSPKAVIGDTVYCVPAGQVVFTDKSLGDDSHIWIFGDGITSTLGNPTHTYAPLAIYTVTLATLNSASGCRDTATITLDLRRPVINFTSADTSFCAVGYTTMIASVTGGFAMSYKWHSPGGISYDSTLSIFVDTFHTPGIYPIRLVIADQNNCMDTLVKNNYIHAAKPIANFNAAPLTGCAPVSVTFTDLSTDILGMGIASYQWSYGDGAASTVTLPTAAHIFTAAGTYTTTEIVTDNDGCTDTATLALVTIYKPNADFVATSVFPCVGASVTFTNMSGAGITSAYWWFGDGTTSTAISPTHAYTTAGTYTVKLAVTDSHGCSDTMTHPAYITVTRPNASFTMDDSFTVCPPMTVHFTNTSTGAVSYVWHLGDGSSSIATNPTNLYITTGIDTVLLIATNMYGCKDTAMRRVILYGYAGAFTYAPLSGCSPLAVTFHASLSNVPTITWDFSDGATSSVTTIDSITHIYNTPGAYIPKLILADNTGCQNSSVGIDTIKVDGVTPGFTTNPSSVCINVPFNLVDTSHSYWSTITTWNWLFDGAVSSISNPSFTINTIGTFPVTLQVVDGWGCTATAYGNVTVYPLPVIKACPDTTICLSDAATLTATGGVSYTWAPPPTLSCTACNPAMASPSVATSYTVTGTDEHGCVNTDTTSVFLKTKTVSVAYRDTEICQGAIVQLLDSGATKFQWTPSAGLSNDHIANPLASPPVTTKYTIIAQLASCIPDTNYLVITVHPLPTVDAGHSQTVTEGSEVQLSATGTLIDKYWWVPAYSLSCDSCPNPVATMSMTTTFAVNVASSFGCLNSDTVTIFVFCDKSQVFIPNSFTPNGDGQNDVFYPRGRGISVIKSFRIYNRWGQMLFERSGIQLNDASNAWDGSFNGGTPRPDVYVYIIDAVCETGAPLSIKGDVTIIR